MSSCVALFGTEVGTGFVGRRSAAALIGRAATVALYEELQLHPKPGLVSFVDEGSHTDMDATTFMRSLFALRRYFP
ncbi:triphosphoribosyl-dephospho-CoA synthase, partial [Roseateles sp. GG27B]